MANVKRTWGIFLALSLVVGCLAIASLMKVDSAYADSGLRSGAPVLETQKSNAPTQKLYKKDLHYFSNIIYFTFNAASSSKWYSTSNKKTGYELQYAKNSSFVNPKKIIEYRRTYTSFTGKNKEAGQTYYFRVRVFNKIDGKTYSGPWSNTYKITIPKYTPTQKLSLTLKAGKKSITASYSTAKTWITNGGGSDAKVSGYEIWWTNSSWSNKHVKFVKDRHTTEVTLKSLTGGSKYMVAVRLYNTVNGVTYYGPWSNTKACTPKKG